MAEEDSYEVRLKTYRRLVAGFPDLAVKGKKMPYAAMNGNMFSFLAPDGTLCVRLSAKDCQAFMQANGTEPVKQYGSVMRDYVAVPDAMLGDQAVLRELFEASVANARILKPKPTKR